MTTTFSIFLYMLAVITATVIAGSDLMTYAVIPFYLTLWLVCGIDSRVTRWLVLRKYGDEMGRLMNERGIENFLIRPINLFYSTAGVAIAFVVLTLYAIEAGIFLIK